MIYQDNWGQAAQLASQVGLSPEQVTEAQARAEKLKTKGQVTAASDAPPVLIK